MHGSSHVNGVQGGQKRIFGKCHECVLFLGGHPMQPMHFSANTHIRGTRRPTAASKVMEECGRDAPLRTKLFLRLHG